MPVFTEASGSARDLRVLRSFADPVPRLTPKFEVANDDEKYEVVIVGAGPAGLFLELLLARYGLTDASLLCIDSKEAVLKSGQADGLQPRTLEVLKSLGLAEEILTEGCQMWEVAFWNAVQNPDGPEARGIERTSIVPDVAVAARFPHEVTIHQGRIERILEDDLCRYSVRGVQRSTSLVSVSIDEAGDQDFPVVAELKGPNGVRKVRTKILVGADGAHSLVRRSMELKLEGETSDFIWGVMDFVASTDFPDIRRRCAIHSDQGSVMVIPRERISSGDYLTRLYVHVQEEVQTEIEEKGNAESKAKAKARREKITRESILAQAQKVFHPYEINLKSEDSVDWWAAYQIGQRVSESFTKKDSQGINRVFIVGDACHTHSPKAGQGMNVSMMDSYNLAWKLVHYIHGLSPTDNYTAPSGQTSTLLNTYETERLTIAKQLIAFDKEFSSMFSGKIGTEDGKDGLTHEQFLEVFSTGNGFTSGCGVEYPENPLIQVHTTSGELATDGVVSGSDYLGGILKAGRRLLNVKVKRHADGYRRELQDDFPSNGRFRILCFASTNLLDSEGTSSQTLRKIEAILAQFPEGVIELVILHPLESNTFVWKEIPAVVKVQSEMRFYNGTELENVYKVYGISQEDGAISVVRPDGYVGIIAALQDTERVLGYLKTCLKTRQDTNNTVTGHSA